MSIPAVAFGAGSMIGCLGPLEGGIIMLCALGLIGIFSLIVNVVGGQTPHEDVADDELNAVSFQTSHEDDADDELNAMSFQTSHEDDADDELNAVSLHTLYEDDADDELNAMSFQTSHEDDAGDELNAMSLHTLHEDDADDELNAMSLHTPHEDDADNELNAMSLHTPHEDDADDELNAMSLHTPYDDDADDEKNAMSFQTPHEDDTDDEKNAVSFQTPHENDADDEKNAVLLHTPHEDVADDEKNAVSFQTPHEDDTDDEKNAVSLHTPHEDDADDEKNAVSFQTPHKDDADDKKNAVSLHTPHEDDADDEKKAVSLHTPHEDDADDEMKAVSIRTPHKDDADDELNAVLLQTPHKDDADVEKNAVSLQTPHEDDADDEMNAVSFQNPHEEYADDEFKAVSLQTPHEDDVDDEMNAVSLRNKQPVSYTYLQSFIDHCNLTKQNIQTPQQFFTQELGNEITNMNEQSEIEQHFELEGGSALLNSQQKLNSNDNLWFPLSRDAKSPEEHLKHEIVTSVTHKKENADDKSYSKASQLFRKPWPPPIDQTGETIRRLTELPQPLIDTKYTMQVLEVCCVFEPMINIVEQIALGRPPAPHVSMRYELLRFCTFRSYPKEDKPYLIKLAEAGFYYASDGDGVVCYCCGIRRYNWTADDQPLKIHKRINPTCKFLITNDEVNVRNNYNGPFSKTFMFIDSIPEPRESLEPDEVVNNDWEPERTRSPTPRPYNDESSGSSNQLAINTAISEQNRLATKMGRLTSYIDWPETASQTPDVLAEAGFVYEGIGDCVRCFCCRIALETWTQDMTPWNEHIRYAKNCMFVNLVQLAFQFRDNVGENIIENQFSAQEIEDIFLSDAAQGVLDLGYQPRIIKMAIDQIRLNLQMSGEDAACSSNCSGYPLKKSHDNTLSEGLVNLLARQMKSVGALIYKKKLGTVFRVGSVYVMTAWHVVQDFVGKSADVLASVSVNFNESLVEHGVSPYMVANIILWNIDLDLAILQIYHPDGYPLPPPLQLFCEEKEYIKFKEVYLIGYGHPNDESKRLDPKCKILWPDSEQVTAAKRWLDENTSSLMCTLKLSGMHSDIVALVEKGYEGLDHPDKLIFDCYLQQGGSGSPALIHNGSDTVKVVGILTHEMPEFYFFLNNLARKKIDDSYLFEMGPKMSSIYKFVLSIYPELASEIFSV